LKKLFVLFSFLLFTSSTPPIILDWSKAEKMEEKEFFLSYPGSGTNWTLSLLQILAKKPVGNGCDSSYVQKYVTNRLNLPLDYSKTTLYRTHFVHDSLRRINPSKNKLLLIVRNYKECHSRALKFHKKNNSASNVYTQIAFLDEYLDPLNFYENWKDSKTKLLIYYEDLITKPRQTIEKLLTFFDEDTSCLDNFFKKYDYWREKVLNSYISQHNYNFSSNGNKKDFHSKDLSVSEKKEMDQFIKKNYPVIWKKYLSRYEG